MTTQTKRTRIVHLGRRVVTVAATARPLSGARRIADGN